jgi:predicted  nucleic acid-binding Zn-ribbon protein
MTTPLEDQISKVQTKIDDVEQQILVVTKKLDGKLSEDDKIFFRDEKKQLRRHEEQLRDEKKQLRRHEEQLREKENLLLARQQPQQDGKLRCCSRIHSCIQCVVRIRLFLIMILKKLANPLFVC